MWNFLMEVENQFWGVIDTLEWLKRPETVRNRSGIKIYMLAMPKLSSQLRSVPKIRQFEDFDENPGWGADFPLEGPVRISL